MPPRIQSCDKEDPRLACQFPCLYGANPAELSFWCPQWPQTQAPSRVLRSHC